ncbi:PDS5A [Bugula neritina]|uniref:PDS5A n=1 Tax=Bugula neritina TaxID=10212 RepID=A0A7J7K667_BUGNE|nr:PDS5A [Bugula neritina]
MEAKRIARGEMSRLRLTAALCILKIVHVAAYAEIITNETFQNLALIINDPVLQVRITFTQKLHKYLLAMKIPLQYMAIFALCANDRVKDRKFTVKQYIELNIQKRREYLKKHPPTNNRILFSLLPDYVIPYAVHLLAHDPELESHDDAPNLRNIKECLWLLLEPLMKDQASFYSFQKKIFEYIKQTKDAQNPDDDIGNKKMWAVCDLGIQIIMQRCPFNSKAVPCGTPLLPAKLFTGLDKSNSNRSNYLPRDLIYNPSRGSANRNEFFKAGDKAPSKEDEEEEAAEETTSAVQVKDKPSGDEFINPEEELDKKMDASERRKKRKSTTTITELTANNSLLPDGAVGEGVQTITVGLVGERGELVEVNKRVRTSYKAAHQNGQTKVVVRQVVEDDDAMEDEDDKKQRLEALPVRRPRKSSDV